MSGWLIALLSGVIIGFVFGALWGEVTWKDDDHE